ncbi:MAG: alpha-L-glutamate ligase [Firmicutes bacterium HGW-Firmicutes-12]|jgi:UDP-N-acetylmuramoyl-tripeptide--D-alanyl-D-alanine ligase|nr:MAG: alpha-L-glutamate ligase [Firmicutes bacterium HGW-Firmicutes-12]
MLTIGMLHHRKDPRTVIKAYAYAAVAKAEGVELIFFSPKGVDFKNRKIRGYRYDDGFWRKIEEPFPSVIYNTGSPEKLKKSYEIINRLKEEIPFTTYSIGHKMAVYERIKKAGEFSQYLIPSEKVSSIKELLNFLQLYHRVILKPVVGHKGQGVILIETCGNDFYLQVGSQQYKYNIDELGRYLSKRIDDEHLLMQPYINCRTKSDCPYDFRLHVQKDGQGKWVITSIYPRIGANGRIATNLNCGGYTLYLEPFLQQEFKDEYYDIKRYLEHFSLQLAQYLDKIQKEYFSEEIDELGIDVAFDDHGKICIYEINWRPGCPPAFYLELDVIRNMIRYAIHLAKEASRYTPK